MQGTEGVHHLHAVEAEPVCVGCLPVIFVGLGDAIGVDRVAVILIALGDAFATGALVVLLWVGYPLALY